MLNRLYYWLHRRISRPQERGEYSSGYWQDLVRTKTLELCNARKGNVLEVGCGEGLFLYRLAQLEKDLIIYGVDNWKDILNKAEDRLKENNIKNVKLYRSEASSMPFEEEFFDIVVCINVFFNLPSKEVFYRSINEIIRVSKKGGKIIFDIRNSKNPLLYIKYKLAKYYDATVKILPLRTYRLTEIISYLENKDFEILRRIKIGFPKNSFAPIFIIEARKKK